MGAKAGSMLAKVSPVGEAKGAFKGAKIGDKIDRKLASTKKK
jgi:hypothetical protein